MKWQNELRISIHDLAMKNKLESHEILAFLTCIIMEICVCDNYDEDFVKNIFENCMFPSYKEFKKDWQETKEKKE